jgi:hydroxymethylglutaryl-CoA lyase
MEIDIEISEVGPRDGLQSIKSIMSTEAKKAWVKAQFDAGTPEIEVGSFVSAELLPQLADTAEVTRYAASIVGLNVAVLAPNLRGLQAAVDNGAHKVSIPFSMSETHSIKNIKRSHPQMMDEIQQCLSYLESVSTKQRPKFEVGLATAFGCTIEGAIAESKVIAIAEKLVEMGVDEVGLSDTTGYGNPRQLKRLAEGIWQNCGREKLNGVHLHNTRGQGLANALMAVEIGITTIDSSLGGIGGCPWAPGASGNIVTEDLVFLLESMGLKTGIDLEALFKVRELVQTALPNEEMYGFTPAAGLPLNWPKQLNRR